MRKYATEFIGTFFLVFTIFCTVVGHKADDGVIPPLAIGFSLMVMIYAGGHISGAHYNPAVTTAVFIRGRCDAKDVPFYMIAQVLGGLLAGFIVTSMIKSDIVIKEPALFKDVTAVLVAEFFFTFALAYVVVNVATAKANAGNSFYGLAIGSTVLVGAFSVGRGIRRRVQSGGRAERGGVQADSDQPGVDAPGRRLRRRRGGGLGLPALEPRRQVIAKRIKPSAPRSRRRGGCRD